MASVCTFEDGCTGTYYCKGLCHRHYKYKISKTPKFLAHAAEYRKTERSKLCVRIGTVARRGRKKGVPYDLDYIREFLVTHPKGFVCEWPKCTKPWMEIDELIPGKGYVKNNISALCRKHNGMKQNHTPQTALEMLHLFKAFGHTEE